MALARWQATITDGAGNIVPNAQVEVRQEIAGSPLARLYTDRLGTVPASNPIAAGADGYVYFHVVGGAYRVTARKGEFVREWRYVGIGRNSESDLAGLRPQGAWHAEISYSGSDYIRHNGRTFVSLVDENVGHEPPDAPADSEVWMWVPLGENAELAIEAREAAEDQADHAEEWAQSPSPISVPAGGDGTTDQSAKTWAGRSAGSAAGAAAALDVVSGLASAFIIAENTFATKATAEAWRPVAAPAYIRSSGYAAEGDGGGALYKKVGSEPSHMGKFFITLADGVTVVWYALAEKVITPRMFGAVGDGTTDDGAALNAMFAFAAVLRVVVNAEGSYATSVPVVAGSPTGSLQTKDYRGYMKVTALGAIPVLVTLYNMSFSVWSGKIEALGTGSATFSTRSCDIGVYAISCGRMKIDAIMATNFRYGGFVTDRPTNNTAMHIGQIRASYCGSGKSDSTSLTANWSSPANSGTSGSNGQYTTLTVDTNVPTWVTDRVVPAGCFINGQFYLIAGNDVAAGTIRIGPWLDAADVAAGSGTLRYVFGAGCNISGSDSNCLSIGMVNADECGVSYRDAALYGSGVQQIIAQASGIGVWQGLTYDSSHLGYNIGAIYTESNTLDMLYMPSGVNYGTIGSVNGDGFAFGKVLPFNRARTTGQSGQPRRSIDRLTFASYKGDTLAFEKSAAHSATEIASRLGRNTPHRELVYVTNSVNVTLPVLEDELDQLFGFNARTVTLIGTGSTHNPTGTITWTAPGGKTVNGGASAAFSGFIGPAVFKMRFERTTNDWIVELASARAPIGSIASTPSFVGQIAVVAGVGYMAIGTSSSGDWKRITS